MANGANNNSSFSFQTRKGNCPYLEQGRLFLNCCVLTVGYLSSKLYTCGEFTIYEFILFPPTFIEKNPWHYRCAQAEA